MGSAYRTYWTSYGGFSALLKSYYLWGSVAFLCVVPNVWICPDKDGGYKWTETALSVTPSMLGFSLGAMAILLAIGPGTFLKVAQSGGPSSFYMKAIAAFFHFMAVQIFSIFAALIVQAWPLVLLSFLGYLSFIYSIACGLAAAATLVDLAEIKNSADESDGD